LTGVDTVEGMQGWMCLVVWFVFGVATLFWGAHAERENERISAANAEIRARAERWHGPSGPDVDDVGDSSCAGGCGGCGDA
jgi:hypothetical protein